MIMMELRANRNEYPEAATFLDALGYTPEPLDQNNYLFVPRASR